MIPKTPPPRATALLFALALVSLPLPAAQSNTKNAAPTAPTEADFPHLIRVSTRPKGDGFRRGDKIVITEVRGDRRRLEPGGTYLVTGTYTLASAPMARIGLSLTLPRGSGPRAVDPRQFHNLERGSGTFSLMMVMREAGQFHVSFSFPDESGKGYRGQGGIYFE